MKVTLKPINKENFEQCIELKVGPTQCGLILPNVNSLAEYSVTPEASAYGIYLDEQMVGFAMYQIDDNRIYDIHRFMIDFDQQGKGIGSLAMKELIKVISELPDCKEKIKIMFLIENFGAEKLYKSLGFVDSGEIEVNNKWRFTEKIFFYYL